MKHPEKIRVVLGLVCTLAVLYVVDYRPAVFVILLSLWAILFFPWRLQEVISFGIAAIFFLLQNYAALEAGIFEFRFKDLMLMPYYEPFMWGFYFTALKRFVSGKDGDFHLHKKALVGLAVTALVFSAFGRTPLFLWATAFSTLLLFALFHTRLDLYYALASLVLGFIVELFGVSTGLWFYPAPDFLGIPYGFATMWLSVGVLGYRFLFPVGAWLAERIRTQGA